MSVAKPSELAITLAAGQSHDLFSEGWISADEVRGRLKLLGFDTTAQQVAAWLGRMARVDAPWVEKRRDRWGFQIEYRVTQYGRTDVANRFPGIRLEMPWKHNYRVSV